MIRFPDKITIEEKYRPAVLEVETQEQADEYFEACVEHCMRITGRSRADAEDVERQNLGYFAGYFGGADRVRVEQLFRCAHPVFGKAAIGTPTSEEAFARGLRMARKR